VRIIIVGGGISGLVTALSLHSAGLHPVVYESAREIHAVGVGINLLPHAVRELTELGLDDALARIALPPQRLVYCDRDGTSVWEEPLGLAAGYHWPQYSVHRGLLQTLLLDAVRRRLPADCVRTGMSLRDFEPDGDKVIARFEDRHTGRVVEQHGDLLIGADGIDSRVRSLLYPHEGPARWNGVHMWRGLGSAPSILGGRSIVVAGAVPGDKFVAYPVEDPQGRGPVTMNWVLETRRDDADPLDLSARRIPTAEALGRLTEWQLPFIDLPTLIGDSPGIYEYPMLDRDPLPRWSFGRATLLGDAAHPMLPMGMNGASQSIIDARVLAWCLTQHPEPTEALLHYDTIRREPVNRLVEANRDLGPEKIIAVAAAGGPDMPPHHAAQISHDYKHMADCVPGTLNTRPTWSTAL
jgi:2-polyprenyl-6-methoxyphenol hydroxylase-like FAD-dependent oxidoreductase